MGHEGQEILIKDALVFLFAAGIVVPLFRLARLPGVIGFVIAGLLLGPAGLGQFASQFHWLEYLTISEPEAAVPFAELGVLFLLFLLGLELSFEKLWALRRIVLGSGPIQSGLSALAIAGVAVLTGLSAQTAIVIGMALALSSTAIVMQLLVESHRAASPTGRTALGVLLWQDLLVAPILIFVGFVSMTDSDQSVATILIEALWQGALAIMIIFLIGRYALRWVFRLAARTGGRDFLMALTLFTVVGAAVITASAGLSLALGAFLAGLLLGETEFKHQAEVDLEPFKGILLGLFFMTVGIGIDVVSVYENIAWVVGGLVLLLLIKTIIAFGAIAIMTRDLKLTMKSSFMLAPAGEFAFLVLGAATAGQLISTELSAIIAAIAGLSMMLIPVLDKLGAKLSQGIPSPNEEKPEIPAYQDLEGHVIIAGFGRVGKTMAHILETEEADLVALDLDSKRVSRGRQEGWKVYLGDAARSEMLINAGGRGAALFVVTVDNAASAEMMVRTARMLRPNAPILARAQDAEHADRLKKAGANYVIPDAIEAGLQMAARALEEFGYDTETVNKRLAVDREEEYRRGVHPENS